MYKQHVTSATKRFRFGLTNVKAERTHSTSMVQVCLKTQVNYPTQVQQVFNLRHIQYEMAIVFKNTLSLNGTNDECLS